MDAMFEPFKRGMIILWFGLFDMIPGGWVLCNGFNATPDLQDRFVVGAGNTYSIADTGGAVNHSHSLDDEDHSHVIGSGSLIAAGSGYAASTSEENTGITVNNADGRPPYYALFYIMKV